jgi:hypothetical protein
MVLLDENLKVIKRIPIASVYHVKTFDGYVLISGWDIRIFDDKLNEMFKSDFNVKDFRFCGFSFDGLRLYVVLDTNWKRWESKLMVFDFLLPLKNRIKKLIDLRGTPLYHQAKSLLLKLKLKEFDEFVRKPVIIPTPDTIPAKINVKAPSEIRWNSYDILTVEVIPEFDIDGLTLDLSDLTRFFEATHNGKPVKSIEFPPLNNGIKIVEEIELIPKYRGEFTSNLIFRWKNLKRSIPVEITVKSIHTGFPIPKYEPIRLLGEGLTSYVWMCRRKDDGLPVAVKILKESEEAGKSFIVEIANWDRLKHLNIVKLYDYNLYPHPYAEMELCDCSLADLADVKLDHLELATTLAKVLDYAHSEGVIHGDLKPSNILLKEGVIMVCDWGMGFTPAYAPPEVLDGNPPDEKADIWSYGVILYEHITGTNPFQGRDDIETHRKVFEVEPDFSGLGSLKGIVEKCLRKDPKERFKSFAEIKRELANTSIIVYSRRFSMSRGKDRLCNILMLADSYELAGDIKTAKKRIDDGIVVIKDDDSRRILEAMNVFMDIKETCLKLIYEDGSIDAKLMWMKFDNFLSYLDDKTRQIVENDPYAGQVIRYIKTVCTDTLTVEELKRIYHVVCERIPHLLRSLL